MLRVLIMAFRVWTALPYLLLAIAVLCFWGGVWWVGLIVIGCAGLWLYRRHRGSPEVSGTKPINYGISGVRSHPPALGRFTERECGRRLKDLL